MNLTAITDPEQAARLHMLDSAALLLCADFQGEKTLIDVGTGAGLPGLPLKFWSPPSRSPCWTAGQAGGLAQPGVRPAGAGGIQAIHARAEEQALVKGYRDSFDFVTARAVANLRLLGELCLPYVKVGGQFLAMKTTESASEVEEAAHCIKLLGARLEECRDYTIPGTDVIHRLVACGRWPQPEGLSPAVGQDPESPAVRPERCLRQPPRIDTLSVQG